jgi:hypothetical protein
MTKTVNYTAEQTARVVAEYTANPSAEVIAALAMEMGKTAKSIVAKLVREGAYVKAGKEKAKRVTKTEVNAEINKNLGINVDLTALTLDALKVLAEATEVSEAAEFA